MTKIVYTMGYGGKKLVDIVSTARSLDATIFDIRFNSRSMNPWFNRSRMQEWLGDRYVHVRSLGNVTYKSETGEIQILNLEGGIATIEHSERSVILLCVCKDYATCHRSFISAELERRGYHVKEISAQKGSSLVQPAAHQPSLFPEEVSRVGIRNQRSR